jgi:hypothetical protein
MGGRRRTLATSLLLGVLALALVPAFASARPPAGPLVDDAEDCLEPVPDGVALPVNDDGQKISLDVLVLLDGVTLERGHEVMEKAAEAYTPLDVSLDYRFEQVAFEPDTPETATAPAASDSDRLLLDAKKWTLGNRPADTDVVYVLTAKDISDAAGRADCIGGVRFPDGAFAIGENYRSEDLLGVFYKNATAKIAGHEIGHLMGAHHHYANCAEGTPGAVAETGPTPCSLMVNYIDFMSLIFNNLEGSVVRGHAAKWAVGGPDADRIATSTVAFTFSKGVARGTVSSPEGECRDGSEIRIQRYAHEREFVDQEWVDVASGRTRAGRFKVKAPGVTGTLRAFLPEQELEDGQGDLVCAQAASAPVSAL